MIRHGVGPYLGLNEIESPSPMIIFIIISYLVNRTFWPNPSPYLLGFYVGAYNSTLCYCFWGRLDMILKT